MVRHVLIPSALTWIFSSLHISIGFAIIAVVVGEYLGASHGVGYLISQAEGVFDTTGVFAGMVVLSAVVLLVGVGVNLTQSPGDLPGRTRLQPTSVVIEGAPADAQGLLTAYLRRLAHWYDRTGFRPAVVDAYRRRCATIGHRVRATTVDGRTVEGEATAHYVSELLGGKGLRLTRIARGLPVGGELEHVDSGTLAQAVLERRPA